MCPECGRAKMLFETESKAKNFIKFNSDDIYHENELRPYFCPACGGYHISSKKYKDSYDTATDRLIKAYKTVINAQTVEKIIVINECYKMIESLNLRDRKKINIALKTDNFSIFPNKIKEQAKVKFYNNYNI